MQLWLVDEKSASGAGSNLETVLRQLEQQLRGHPERLRRIQIWWGERDRVVTLRELAITDFKLKYQGSALGYLWSFARPLLLFAVLYFVFNRFFRIGASVPHYALFLLLGIVLWSFFTDSTLVAMTSICPGLSHVRRTTSTWSTAVAKTSREKWASPMR